MTIDTGHPDSGIVEIEIPSRVDFVAVVRMIVAAATNAVEALQGERLDDLRWVTSEATTNAIEANLAAVPEGPLFLEGLRAASRRSYRFGD